MSLEATIKITPETRDAVNALKRGVETQNDVILRLLNMSEKINKTNPRSNLAGRPEAAAGYEGRFWLTREGVNTKTRIWCCVQNDVNGWEWTQLATST